MNSKIQLALLTGRNKEKGFSTGIAVGMGLIALAVGLTMVARGQASQNSASSQKASGQVAGIADVGISRTQALLVSVPDLARMNYSDWGPYVKQQDQVLQDKCGNTTTITFEDQLDAVISDENKKVGNGEYEIVNYIYNDTNKSGTLTIRAITDNGAKKQIKTVIPVKSLNGDLPQPPGLWVKTFQGNGDQKIGETNQKVNADVVTQDCSAPLSDFDPSKNFPTGSNWKVLPQPQIEFPDLPPLPSQITQVTDLATCSNVTSYNDLSNGEKSWLAQWFDKMNGLLISSATAQSIETKTIYLNNNTQKSFSLTLDNDVAQTKGLEKGVSIQLNTGDNKKIITYTVSSNITSKTTQTFQYSPNNGNNATWYTVNVTFVPYGSIENPIKLNTTNFTSTITLPQKSVAIDVFSAQKYLGGTTIFQVNGQSISNSTNVKTTHGKVAITSDNPAKLNYTLDDNKLNITSAITDSFTYTMQEGTTYYMGTVNITINPASSILPQNYTSNIQLPNTTVEIATLPNGVSPTIVTQGTSGQASIDSNGKLTYTVSSSKTNTTTSITDTFTYKYSNSDSIGTVTVNILPAVTADETEVFDLVVEKGTTVYAIATKNKIETFTSPSSQQGVTMNKSGLKNLAYQAGAKFDNITSKQTDTFTYTYKQGQTTKTVAVTININPPNTIVSNNNVSNNQTNYTLPGNCTSSYNPTTKTYDFLVSSLEADQITIQPGTTVRIFVQNNIDLRGNAGIAAQANALQIYGSNGAGIVGYNTNGTPIIDNSKKVNYALTADSNIYTVQEVLTKGGANIYAFLFAPAAKAGVAGGGNGGGFYGTMWVNNWAGAPFGSSSNKIVIDPPPGTNWALLPEELQKAIVKLTGGGIKSISSYESEPYGK